MLIVVVIIMNVVRCRLDWPVRTLSFSYDGHMLASASEDLVIDIADVETGQLHQHVNVEETFPVNSHTAPFKPKKTFIPTYLLTTLKRTTAKYWAISQIMGDTSCLFTLLGS